MQRDFAELFPIQPRLAGGETTDEMDRQLVGGQSVQEMPDLVHQRPADGVLGGDLGDDQLPGLRAGFQRLAQQVEDVIDLHAARAHHLR